MKVFYTFGRSETQPFHGGWVEVTAHTLPLAHAAFRALYPDKTPGVLNCADWYTEEEFLKTDMPEKGNFDRFCISKIFVTVTEGVTT